MKNVLVVDHDTILLEPISAAVAERSAEFALATAADSKEASTLLRSQRMDLLCVDLGILTMPGLSLLAYLLEHAPDLPLLILTSQDLEQLRRRITDFGSLVFCEKPLTLPRLIELVHARPWHKADAQPGCSLVNVLQLLHLGQKTCMVILRCDGHEGLIAFRAGQISNATCGDVAGQAALEQLLGWQRPMIEVADDMFSPGRTIYAPFAQTLGEAAPRELVVEDDVAEELPAPAATIEEPIGIASPEACEQEEARRRPRADGEDELLSVLLLADSEQQLVARLAEIHDTGPIAALHTTEDEGALERIEPSEAAQIDHREPSEAAPLVFETLYDRASAALSAGDVTSANAYISALLAQDPLRLGAHFLLARLYEQVGEHNQAIAAYRRTVFLEHGFVPGHLGMAVGFKALGRPADMQRCYRNALKLLSLMPPESPIAELGGAKVHELVANIARESV